MTLASARPSAALPSRRADRRGDAHRRNLFVASGLPVKCGRSCAGAKAGRTRPRQWRPGFRRSRRRRRPSRRSRPRHTDRGRQTAAGQAWLHLPDAALGGRTLRGLGQPLSALARDDKRLPATVVMMPGSNWSVGELTSDRPPCEGEPATEPTPREHDRRAAWLDGVVHGIASLLGRASGIRGAPGSRLTA